MQQHKFGATVELMSACLASNFIGFGFDPMSPNSLFTQTTFRGKILLLGAPRKWVGIASFIFSSAIRSASLRSSTLRLAPANPTVQMSAALAAFTPSKLSSMAIVWRQRLWGFRCCTGQTNPERSDWLAWRKSLCSLNWSNSITVWSSSRWWDHSPGTQRHKRQSNLESLRWVGFNRELAEGRCSDTAGKTTLDPYSKIRSAAQNWTGFHHKGNSRR